MGWIFILLGILSGAIGTFLIYYGQDLLRQPQPAEVEAREIALSPEQERLLGLLADYHKQFAATKLVVGRETGVLHFDADRERGHGISLITDLYGEAQREARASDFERLMESLPPLYVRFYSEMRMGSPFVASVTDEGIKYLRSNR